MGADSITGLPDGEWEGMDHFLSSLQSTVFRSCYREFLSHLLSGLALSVPPNALPVERTV